MIDMSANSHEDTEKFVSQELSDLDCLSPLVGESGWGRCVFLDKKFANTMEWGYQYYFRAVE